VLVEAGGFDEAFKEAIVEDVELGYRLERRGIHVLYREDAVCEHEHALTVDDYFRRALRLGVNQAKMLRKHQDPAVIGLPVGSRMGRDLVLAWQVGYESRASKQEEFLATARRWSEGFRGKTIPAADLERLRAAVFHEAWAPYCRGMLMEFVGHDPERARVEGPPRGELTSIVAPSYNALEKTRNFVEALRRTADPAFPTELVIVDNGSNDGSAEWLAAQPDVRLVRNPTNEGAPRARNQALSHVKGANVLFMDNDIVVTPGWLERMLYHLAVDAGAACVAACADRASHGQQVDYAGPTDPASLARFAGARARQFHRQFQPAAALASYCLLVRGEVIEKIGGWDERFSPWGFEDDDYTLRAYFAGWHNRIALDVWLHHDTYAGPKLERHLKLLDENWRRFKEKWRLGDARYGDYSGLKALDDRGVAEGDLHVPFREGGAAGLRTAAAPAR
jgi:GT2 family glycosyltransferase